MTKTIAHELDHEAVTVTSVRANIGRGLIAARPFREGDVIISATCLYLDDEQKTRAFMNNTNFCAQSVVGVKNVRTPEDDDVTLYCPLVGVAQFALDFNRAQKNDRMLLLDSRRARDSTEVRSS